MNLNKHDAQTEMEMDMTPMIDVVFLLIIFFMIVTDLTQQDLEEVELPVAVTCVADKPNPDEWRPIVNINTRGEMIFKKKSYYDPETSADFKELGLLLNDFARRMDQVMDPDVGMMLPDEPLLIRSDQNTPFKYVQKLMEECGRDGVRIWKIELAAKEPTEAQRQTAANN